MDHQLAQIFIDERSSFLLIEFSTFEQCETTEGSVGGFEWLVLVIIYVSRWRWRLMVDIAMVYPLFKRLHCIQTM
jgi:hypothetical protein